MNKYLLFRTDRIGDFLLSSILIKSLKRNDKDSYITVISSAKNYEYIKTHKNVDEVILFPSNNLIGSLKLLFSLLFKTFFCIIVLDGKKRSIYFSIFLRSKKKFLVTTKLFFKRIFLFFFTNSIYDDYSKNKIEIMENLLAFLNFTFDTDDLNFLKKRNIDKKDQMDLSVFNSNSNYTIFHLDEKWLFNKYIKTYSNIEPSLSELDYLISEIVISTNQNLVITTGLYSDDLINSLRDDFSKINNNVFLRKINNKYILLFDKLSFLNIEFLLSKANLFIGCHGASTHLAAAFNIKIFDIVDESEKLLFEK